MRVQTLALVWKEWRSLAVRAGDRAGLLRMAGLIGLGVYLSHLLGESFGVSTVTIVMAAGIAAIAALPMAAESIATEREQHTLETLLASPASTSDVVVGKWSAITLYGSGAGVLIVVAGLLTRVITGYGLASVEPFVVLESLVAALVASSLASALGVVVSARARTARDAVQTLTLSMVVLALVPWLVSSLVSPAVTTDATTSLGALDRRWLFLAGTLQSALLVGIMLFVAVTIMPRMQESR